MSHPFDQPPRWLRWELEMANVITGDFQINNNDSDLDILYTQILSSAYTNTVNIVEVLGFIIAFDAKNLPEVVEDILGMEEGQLKRVLCGLSSFIKDENDENGERLNREIVPYVIPNFAQASFSDYLFNSSRSGSFHVNLQEYKDQVTIRSFKLIIQLIRSWRMSSITRVLHTTTWGYFTSCLPDRFSRSSKVVKEAIMADIDDLVQEFWRTSNDEGVEAPFFEMRRLLEILEACLGNFEMPNLWVYYSSQFKSDPDALDQIKAKLKILLEEYRKMFNQSFSKSKDLSDMLRLLSGVVVQKHMSMQGMADLYRIKPDLLERLIKSTIEPLRPSRAPDPRYILDDYLSGFLQNQDRSQLNYSDPIIQHISICRHFLSLLDRSNAFELQSHELSDYVYPHFYDHLCAATSVFQSAQNIPHDHPAVEFLQILETTAYYVDENLSDYILKLARFIIQAILRWVYINILNCRQKNVAVSVFNDGFVGRVSHLVNKIYREMLCIRSHEGKTFITMGGLGVPWTPKFSTQIVLNWHLLAWISVEGEIPCSFTKFITTPGLSGRFYISPDDYHTQITEYSLETIHQSSPSKQRHAFLNPDWSFKEHLPRAHLTTSIIFLFRSIHSECLVRHYSTESMIDTLKIIIKWLQGLGNERPRDLYDRFQAELLRHKAPSTYV